LLSYVCLISTSLTKHIDVAFARSVLRLAFSFLRLALEYEKRFAMSLGAARRRSPTTFHLPTEKNALQFGREIARRWRRTHAKLIRLSLPSVNPVHDLGHFLAEEEIIREGAHESIGDVIGLAVNRTMATTDEAFCELVLRKLLALLRVV